MNQLPPTCAAADDEYARDCPFDPRILADSPVVGVLYCPDCGCVVVAGIAHPICDIEECVYGVTIGADNTEETSWRSE